MDSLLVELNSSIQRSLEMSFQSDDGGDASYNNPFKEASSAGNTVVSECPMVNAFQLKSAYPMGMILDAFVTNVHNVPQLRFFMFVKNVENAEHFANIHNAATPPNAYKCLRMPREGYVFALRLGESTMVRAVRLRTMCITTTREAFLPDIGRNEILNEDEAEMYHLPLRLRTPPGVAIPCQLRGINDDVTILPHNMRSFIKGLLFHSVKLRVDGYIGNILKVQLMDVTLDHLIKWATEIELDNKDFLYALKQPILYKSENENENIMEDGGGDRTLSPIGKMQDFFDDESNEGGGDGSNDETYLLSSPMSRLASASLSSIFSPFQSSKSSSSTLDATIVPSSSNSSIDDLSDSTLVNIQDNTSFNDSISISESAADTTFSLNTNGGAGGGGGTYGYENKSDNFFDTIRTKKLGFRPLLGRINTQARPILGGLNAQLVDNSWKRDILPALVIIDNRQTTLNFSRDELLTITPTYIGQLERFFGIVHRRNESYMQHMWTDDEVPWTSRFNGARIPYVFDVVLAKHSGDLKWYRAKVVEISKEKRKVLVFFVDYGGVEYVDIWNLANLSRPIAMLPFQAVLFRLSDLVDITNSKAERSFGIELLRGMLLKKTLTVRVVNCRGQEITIYFEDHRFSNIPGTLIRKGFMKHYGAM